MKNMSRFKKQIVIVSQKLVTTLSVIE